MPPAIEQHLVTLLPTKSLLPPQLVSLATSLLAQSKASAPKLKPAEEIAREYACAHIACERLTNKLALDMGQVAPPCGPRIYNKLHRFLDGILTAGRNAPPTTTPRSRKTIDVSSPAIPHKSPAAVATPRPVISTPSGGSAKKRKRSSVEPEEQEQTVPEHMIQLGHHLCRTASIHQAAPHVFAGLERLHRELDVAEPEEQSQTPNRRARKLTAKAESLLPRSSKVRVEPDRLPLLVVAVAHQTFRKMRTMESTASDSAEELEMVLSAALSHLAKQEAGVSTLIVEPIEALVKQVEELSEKLQSLAAWHDWLDNVPIIDDPDAMDASDMAVETEDYLLPSRAKMKQTPLRRKEKHGHLEDEDDVAGPAGLLPGLGTMFQPAFDWLSDERQKEYEMWERGLREQLATVSSNA